MTTKDVKAIADQLGEQPKMGDIKKLAKTIKKDHELALALWATGTFSLRMLAALIFDKTLIDQEFADSLADDLAAHDESEKNQITDWLLANQFTKSKKTIQLLESWQQAKSPVLRRLFWYHQARLRWTGQTPPDNTEALLEALEQDITQSEPEVQWAMNFTAGQIGIHDKQHRNRCIKLGETTGLYKEEKVPRGCTPNYLPEFIRIEVAKREG